MDRTLPGSHAATRAGSQPSRLSIRGGGLGTLGLLRPSGRFLVVCLFTGVGRCKVLLVPISRCFLVGFRAVAPSDGVVLYYFLLLIVLEGWIRLALRALPRKGRRPDGGALRGAGPPIPPPRAAGPGLEPAAAAGGGGRPAEGAEPPGTAGRGGPGLRRAGAARGLPRRPGPAPRPRGPAGDAVPSLPACREKAERGEK